MTKEKMREIAQRAALAHGAAHSYTPKSVVESLQFEPHEWVLEAMQAVRDISVQATSKRGSQ